MEKLSQATGEDRQRCVPSTLRINPLQPHPNACLPSRVCTPISQLCDRFCPQCTGYQRHHPFKGHAPWPWIIHHPSASPFCQCHLLLRREWVRREWNSGPTSSAELIELIEVSELDAFRPACKHGDYDGSGCACKVCYESDISESDVSESDDSVV